MVRTLTPSICLRIERILVKSNKKRAGFSSGLIVKVANLYNSKVKTIKNLRQNRHKQRAPLSIFVYWITRWLENSLTNSPILMPWTKMFISIAFLSKCFCAHATRIRFFTAVNSFMIFQCIRSVEAFFTGATTVAPFITMNQSMLVINRSRQKCFITIQTLVRPFTCANVKQKKKKNKFTTSLSIRGHL